jgi:hypothetical protein
MLTKKQAEIKEALGNKNYKLCDNLNLDLVKLQETLDSIPTASSISLKIKVCIHLCIYMYTYIDIHVYV